jgi:cysteine desulfurase/selenocysteine lyase
VGPGGPTSAPAAPATGGFDVDALARLANEYLRTTSAPIDLQHAVPVSAAAPKVDTPSLPGASPHTWAGAAPVTGAPSVPTAVTTPALPTGAVAPALPGLPTTFPNQPVSPPGIPGEAELRSLLGSSPSSLPSSLPGSFPTPADPASYYFLSEAPAKIPAASRHPAPAMPGDPWTPPVPLVPHGIPPFDIERVRRDFPILEERVNGRRLVWLDNAATTQKPRQIIDRLSHFYQHENSNIHRAAHILAARATDAYEGARKKCRGFLNARSEGEIVFVRGATEAINLVAHTWGKANLKDGDEIVITHLEHHANIVPWQQVCAVTGATLRVAPVDDRGQIILEEYARLLNQRTKLVSLTQVSNALGTITPAKRMTELAHAAGALVLVDGAQAVSHMPIDVQAIGCDWYVFSGHKVFAPTGIGVLYGKQAVLDAMPPWQGGGNMIADVTFDHTTYQPAPFKFEAGTGNIADAVGLGAAIDYVTAIGMEKIAAYEHNLLDYGTALLRTVPGLRLIGTAADKASVLSFVIDGIPTSEVGKALDKEGIAVRSGHHCAQPILRRFGLEATVRPSLAFYNTCADLDALLAALLRFRARLPR